MPIYRFVILFLVSLTSYRCSLNTSIEGIGNSSSILDFAKTEIVISGPSKSDGITPLIVTILLKNSDNTPVPAYRPKYNIKENPGLNFGECTTSDINGFSYCTLTSTVPGNFTLVLANAKVGLSRVLTFKPLLETSKLNLASAGLVNATTNMGSKLTLTLGKLTDGGRIATSAGSVVDFNSLRGQE